MKVYLNYYRNIHSSIGSRIAVSSTVPTWCEVDKQLSYLAPPLRNRLDYKNGKIDFSEFSEIYKGYIIDNNLIAHLVNDISSEGDCTLLCYEVTGCHREVLGEALKYIGFDVYNIRFNGDIIPL